MKVGIITLHHTTNYGATFQAYGLWKAIKQLGHEVEIIDYRSYKVARAHLGKCLPIRNTQIWNSQFIPYSIQAWKMRKFLIDNMDLSRKKTYTNAGLKKFSQDYDVVICGSDEIWHINSPLTGFDSSFFIDFVDPQTSRKVSYAPSFSQTQNLGEHKELICNLINQFDAISVRDSHSLSLIEECDRGTARGDRSAQVVLDPTLLVDFSQLQSEPKQTREYLLLYTVKNFSPEQENWLKYWINSSPEFKKLPIISLGKKSNIADLNLISVDPKQWLGYFKNASYIMTNSYHGTIFSLKSERPFTVFTSIANVKIRDLLKKLGLESRIIDQTERDSYPEPTMNIDYDSVNKTLEKEIVKSKNYLSDAIEGNKTEQLAKKVS